MTWLYLSILAAFIWAVVNTITKVVVSQLVTNPYLPVIALGFVDLIVGGFVLLFFGMPIASAHLLLAFCASILYMLGGTLFFFRALQHDEVSRVVPLFALGQIFVPIIAAVFLGEVFGLSIYTSIALVVAGSFLILWRPQSGLPYSWKTLLLMIISTLSYAVHVIILKYLLGFYPFWSVLGYIMVGDAVVAIIMLWRHFADVRATKRKIWAIMIGEESLNLAGLFVFTMAASVGFVTLVDAVAASQYIFIFFIGLIMSRFFPKIIKEDLTWHLVLFKLFATVLIIGGVVVIAIQG